MKAVLYHSAKDVRVETIPEPVCGSDQIKIAPSYVGICGTDIHEYIGGPVFCPSKPHAITGDVVPITMGHEFSGVVTDIGPEAEAKGGPKGLKVGDKVVVQPTISCGDCGACRSDRENCCYKGGFIGLSGSGGGLANFVTVPARRALKLPDNVPLKVGALVEPLAVAWHAISQALDLKEGASVLIMGAGPIGLAILQCLQAKKVAKTIISEISGERQKFAKQFGANHIFNPIEEDVAAKCVELCPELGGVDVVFDCAGVPPAIETAFKAVRAHGTVVNVAIWEKAVPFNPMWLVWKEVRYTATLGYLKPDFEYVLQALGEGKLDPVNMITEIRPYEKAVSGFQELIENKESHVKILLEVAGG